MATSNENDPLGNMKDWLEGFTEALTKSGVHADMHDPSDVAMVDSVEKALSEQQRVSGFAWPPSYRRFLQRYDGGSFNDNDAGIYIHFFSTVDYKDGCSLQQYNAADSVLMDHEIETYHTFESLVIFGADEGSSFWAFDPAKKHGNGEMPVRYCDHETGDIYIQSKDFESFMLLVSNGRLEYRGHQNPIVRGKRSWDDV